MTIKGIIFDLDGTLVDTLGDLTDSMNAALAQLGRPACTADQCRQMIGAGLRTFAERALGPGHVEFADTLLTRMVEHYQHHCLIQTTPYPGIAGLVAELSRRGIRLAVLTNKNQRPSETILGRFFAEGVFDPIVGADPGRKVKPDPRTTLDIVAGWGLERGQVLFVGDSDIDIHTARAAQVRCIACEWGFRDKDQLLAAGAETFIQRPEQLLEML